MGEGVTLLPCPICGSKNVSCNSENAWCENESCDLSGSLRIPTWQQLSEFTAPIRVAVTELEKERNTALAEVAKVNAILKDVYSRL